MGGQSSIPGIWSPVPKITATGESRILLSQGKISLLYHALPLIATEETAQQRVSRLSTCPAAVKTPKSSSWPQEEQCCQPGSSRNMKTLEVGPVGGFRDFIDINARIFYR